MPIIVHYFVLSKEFSHDILSMTTAEPPEPLVCQHPVSIIDKHNHQVIGGLRGGICTTIVYFLVFLKRFSLSIELPHDAVPASRSDDNRRAAGAVHISAFIIHYVQTKHIGVCRPGGEAFWFIQCILWTLH